MNIYSTRIFLDGIGISYKYPYLKLLNRIKSDIHPYPTSGISILRV